MSQPDRLTFAQAKQIAKTAGARDVANVTSYLVHCRDQRDADNSLAALRKTQPEYFSRARQGRAR